MAAADEYGIQRARVSGAWLGRIMVSMRARVFSSELANSAGVLVVPVPAFFSVALASAPALCIRLPMLMARRFPYLPLLLSALVLVVWLACFLDSESFSSVKQHFGVAGITTELESLCAGSSVIHNPYFYMS